MIQIGQKQDDPTAKLLLNVPFGIRAAFTPLACEGIFQHAGPIRQSFDGCTGDLVSTEL
jgi:hypothetical protein